MNFGDHSRTNSRKKLMLLVVLTMFFSCTETIVPEIEKPLTLRWPIFSANGSQIVGIGIKEGGAREFFRVDTSGGVAEQISSGDGMDKMLPQLSPDGTKILYIAAEPLRIFQRPHIWVMNADGSNTQDITSFGGYFDGPRWAPDSKRIVFFGPIGDNELIENQVLSINFDGTDLGFLTKGHNGNWHPRWSYNGNKIFFVSGRSNSYGTEVYVMDADGSNQIPLDSLHRASHFPRPSPKRNEVLLSWKNFESGMGGYLVNLDNSSLPAGESSFKYSLFGYVQNSEWSPNGEYIAQVRGKGTPVVDLFVLDRDGGNERRLTNGFDIYSFSWSRNSKRIVFHGFEDQKKDSLHTFIADTEQGLIKKLSIFTRR